MVVEAMVHFEFFLFLGCDCLGYQYVEVESDEAEVFEIKFEILHANQKEHLPRS